MRIRGKEIVRVRDFLSLILRGPDGFRRFFDGGPPPKDPVTVSGHLTLRVKNPAGDVVQEVGGDNIWTLTGREFLAELMALSLLSPDRTPVRDDRVLYIGVGGGSTPEVPEIYGLVDPMEYRIGEFLAPCQVPASFPEETSRTSVQFIREFASNEISLGASVIITEAGLYTDGDPNNDNAIPAPTDFATASTRAPVAYKTFEPVTKPEGFALEAVWEIRIR